MHEARSLIVVDDDASLLDVIKTGLISQGYKCETAIDAASAIKLINKIPFDVMITDIKMPGVKGFELTISARKIRPDMSVIIMTGFIDEFSYDSTIEAGAADFIKKPFTLTELIARIKHVKLQEKLRIMSVTDELTGLYNRRGFFTLAEQQLRIADRLKRKIFMLYVDLNNLKVINDTFGHQEGDRALINISNIFKKTFRKSDIIARIGGDEFVIIPVGTTKAGTKTSTSRLKKNIREYNSKRNKNYRLALSFGISHYDPKFPSSLDEMIMEADRSMYEQKRNKMKY